MSIKHEPLAIWEFSSHLVNYFLVTPFCGGIKQFKGPSPISCPWINLLLGIPNAGIWHETHSRKLMEKKEEKVLVIIWMSKWFIWRKMRVFFIITMLFVLFVFPFLFNSVCGIFLNIANQCYSFVLLKKDSLST